MCCWIIQQRVLPNPDLCGDGERGYLWEHRSLNTFSYFTFTRLTAYSHHFLFMYLLDIDVFNPFFNLLTCPHSCPVVSSSRSSPPVFTAAFHASVLNHSARFNQCPFSGYLMTTDTTSSTPGTSTVLKNPTEIPSYFFPTKEVTSQEVWLI